MFTWKERALLLALAFGAFIWGCLLWGLEKLLGETRAERLVTRVLHWLGYRPAETGHEEVIFDERWRDR